MHPGHLDTDEQPFVLVWEVTQACDLACKHCRAEAEPECHPDELTTTEGTALLDEAARFGDGQIVVLSGGDPMVRGDTVDLVRYGTDQGLRMTMTPSGTASLTPERIADLVEAGLDRMALSIDGGTALAHDEFRQEAGSFATTIAAAEAARDVGLPLQINTTVCAETLGELPAIRDLVADLGAVLWSVFFLVPVGRGAVLDPVTPGQAEAVMEWLVAVRETAPFGVKTTEAPQFRRVALQRQTGDGTVPSDGSSAGDDSDGRAPEASGNRPDTISRRNGITAGDGFAFVSHRGELYPSGFLPESAGTVRDGGLLDRYRNAPLFEQLRDVDALQGKCGACPYRSVCGGSRSRAHATTGNPLESDPLCPFVPVGYDGPLPESWAGLGPVEVKRCGD